MARAKANNVDEHIADFPEETQVLLEKIRSTIKKAIPKAEEVISYAIPCFKQDGGYIIYFAGFKSHVSIYPVPKGDEVFNKTVTEYRTGKGTLQFQLDRKLPLSFITKVVKYRLVENKLRAELKAAKKKIKK